MLSNPANNSDSDSDYTAGAEDEKIEDDEKDISVFIAVYGNSNPAYITNFFNNQKEKVQKNLTADHI